MIKSTYLKLHLKLVMLKITTFLTVLCLTSLTQQACLPEATLKSLGFSTVKSAVEKIDSADVCKTLFKDQGTCVDVDDVKKMLDKVQDDLGDRTDLKGDLQKVFENILETKSVKDSSDNTTKVNAIADKITAESQNTCFKSLAEIQMGVVCLLASGQASDFVDTASGGVTVKLHTATTGGALKNCLDIYDGICLTTTSTSFTQDIQLDTDDFKKKAAEYESKCTNLKGKTTCTDNCTSLQTGLIDFNPLSFDFFPAQSFWDTMLSSIDSLKDKTTDWFKNLTGTTAPVEGGRMLLGTSSFTVTASSNTTGYDAVASGKDSGVTVNSYEFGTFLMVLNALAILIL